jgi:hypothetical protein
MGIPFRRWRELEKTLLSGRYGLPKTAAALTNWYCHHDMLNHIRNTAITHGRGQTFPFTEWKQMR